MLEGPSLSAGRLRINNLLGGRRWKAFSRQIWRSTKRWQRDGADAKKSSGDTYTKKRPCVAKPTDHGNNRVVASTCAEDPAE